RHGARRRHGIFVRAVYGGSVLERADARDELVLLRPSRMARDGPQGHGRRLLVGDLCTRVRTGLHVGDRAREGLVDPGAYLASPSFWRARSTACWNVTSGSALGAFVVKFHVLPPRLFTFSVFCA